MNLKRCEHGHFYDQEKFASCPHCTGGNGEANVTKPLDLKGNVSERATEPVTVPMRDMGNMSQAVTQPEKNVSGLEVIVPENNPPSDMSLQYALDRAKKTSGREITGMEDEQKTISIYQAKAGIEPVAGWLVCIEGAAFGASYTLKTGRNFIGRGADMDVVLSEDTSVSRQRHAVILYEPRRREFLAQPGDSRELFYLNDEVVLGAEKINQNDILTVGNTKLMFFPCCGENFSWDDFKKDE